MVCTFWSGLGTDPQRILRGQKLLLTHPSKRGGVAPKPRDPCSTAAGLDNSLFTTVCDCSPSKTCIYIASSLSLIHFKITTLTYWVKHHWKKKKFKKKKGDTQTSIYGEEDRIQGDPFNLHTTSAPHVTARCQTGVNRATLISTNMQKDLLRMTCRIIRSRCQLTKAARPRMETKPPKWHLAITYVGHVNISHCFAAVCICLGICLCTS